MHSGAVTLTQPCHDTTPLLTSLEQKLVARLTRPPAGRPHSVPVTQISELSPQQSRASASGCSPSWDAYHQRETHLFSFRALLRGGLISEVTLALPERACCTTTFIISSTFISSTTTKVVSNWAKVLGTLQGGCLRVVAPGGFCGGTSLLTCALGSGVSHMSSKCFGTK